MGERTKIQWCDHTFNPWRGCAKVSAGCDNCYAERQAKRNPKVLGEWGVNGRRAIAAFDYWRQPLRWNKEAGRRGVRRRVFCGSLMDFFEGGPAGRQAEVENARMRTMHLIAETPNLDWLLLTKRPELVQSTLTWLCQTMYDEGGGVLVRNWQAGWTPENVWLGTTVENQEMADKRIPILLKIPARVRFLSCEPLLGPVDLRPWLGFVHADAIGASQLPSGYPWPLDEQPWYGGLDWVICGGESGEHARPMHPDWARSLRDQCQAASVPFFFKQWGEWREYDNRMDPLASPSTGELPPRTIRINRDGSDISRTHLSWHDGDTHVIRVGKKSSGRLLDGREWNEMLTL
jgi:protein gp37